MSTLVAQTISNGTVSTSSANVIQGSAKAWVVFTGSTVAISGSYNVSSVTYTAGGRYVVNFTNALANANYAFSGSGSDAVSTLIVSFYSPGSATTTSCAISTTNTGGYGDNPRISVIFHSN
jgi:hypothetical protein